MIVTLMARPMQWSGAGYAAPYLVVEGRTVGAGTSERSERCLPFFGRELGVPPLHSLNYFVERG